MPLSACLAPFVQLTVKAQGLSLLHFMLESLLVNGIGTAGNAF